MTEFGENGTVVGASAAPPTPDYMLGADGRKVRRVKLALFLCSLAACILVAILGGVCAGLTGISAGVFGYNSLGDFSEGLQIAFTLSAMNWILFFITIPAAWLALGLSIGRMPHRGITRPAPYLRWGAIWGAILVAGTTAGFSALEGPVSGLGGLIGGIMVGAPAGLACGGIFLSIVKPRQQLGNQTVDVF